MNRTHENGNSWTEKCNKIINRQPAKKPPVVLNTCILWNWRACSVVIVTILWCD